MSLPDKETSPSKDKHALTVPSISLPKGGGAIRSIGEKFASNPVTGTGSMTVPIASSPGRSGFGPQLSLSYDSGAGNGPFGLGWSLSLPSITRKTDKGLPRYRDDREPEPESDVFMLSGAEDLVPVLVQDARGSWKREELPPRTVDGTSYLIRRYRPRVEGLFARIERWTNSSKPDDVFWRSISKDNVTTWYGRSEHSRIADPEHPERIFSWLICESYDDKGNEITYRYKSENAENIDLSPAHQRNRGDQADPRRTVNKYIKRIRYGNHVPYFPELLSNRSWPDPPGDNHWHFEVVFDYGEHDATNPTPQETGIWSSRPDPFSAYRSTFEIRTHRLCRRILMFHHFPDDPESQKGYDGLVRSTDFTYQADQDRSHSLTPVYSKLMKVTQNSYRLTADGTYLTAALPPVEFTYSEAVIQTEVHEIDNDSLANVPVGIDGTDYLFVDLDGEGMSGVLTEQANAWFYKRNLGPTNLVVGEEGERLEAKFAPMEPVSPKPDMALAGQARFLDLAGDGLPELVQYAGPTPGFYERTTDGEWEPFVPFASLPQVNWSDPNLKFIDLDGDGRADILISEHDAFVWHRSLGEKGFEAARRKSKPWDEEKGPHIVFADEEQSIHLSDMSGDGLIDIVRIRNKEVCYWPNLGYGRFGAKVTMDNAPRLDYDDQFDPGRIRLADIDGSGTTDLIYLCSGGVHIYFNQCGNSWSDPTAIGHVPAPDPLTRVQVADLLGNGTACLVWSSSLPGDARRPLRYLNLIGGQKPHLLVKTVNNLGAETTVEYAPSTKFYLQDKQAGKPWITKLPGLVHCVEKVTVHDKWRKATFTTTYSYHHGYFDGPEREFRGFGRVEQVDVENYGKFAAGNASSPYITDDQTLYQPPVKTVTWYHTGAFFEDRRILEHFKEEYFPNGVQQENPGAQGLGAFREHAWPEPDLDALDLSADERREALRACKGTMLRQEVYELDVDLLAAGTHKPVKLFTAACRSVRIRLVQPKAANPHAVFHVAESEAITYHYELDLYDEQPKPDPRVVHTLNLSVDEYGNVLQSVTAVYPRLGEYADAALKADALELIRHVQSERHASYTETRYTDDVLDPDNCRLRLPCEILKYELTGMPVADRYFTLDELRACKLSGHYPNSGTIVEEIAYHTPPDGVSRQKRIVEHTRTLFFDTALDKPLKLGQLNALALTYETYKLAHTDDLLGVVFGDKLSTDVAAALTDKKTSGYLSGAELIARLGANSAGQYWVCSGVAGFHADASRHFFLPERFTDPFGNETILTYDPRDLYIRSSTDALGNRTEVAEFDFRVMAACRMKDANDNVSEVRFDILGMPAVMAVTGKGTEADSLNGFDDAHLNLDSDIRRKFFHLQDYDEAYAKQLLKHASMRYVYHFGESVQNGTIAWGQHPACACTIRRERHAADEPDSPLQCGFEYSDGTGNVLVKKAQAEPEQPGGPLRWVAGGKTILNNKGKPVKQYEPYFSPPEVGHRFEEPIEAGVTPVIYYDAVGRAIRTDSPDGSYSRIQFSPWHVARFDANDTIKEDGNAWFAGMSAPTASAEERLAARLAAEHADTPAVTVLDSLGREVVEIAHNRVGSGDAASDEKYVTFTKLDAEGRPLWVQDARGNQVMQTITPQLQGGVHPFHDPNNLRPQLFSPCYDLAGRLLFQHGMDTGDRWMLHDAAGKPMFAWNSRLFKTRMTYDELQRPLGSFVIGADPADPAREIQFAKQVYGEGQDRDKQRNLRGRLYKQYDTAGLVATECYDFKGNPLRTVRQMTSDYKSTPDWSRDPALEAEAFAAGTRYDALNRPVQIVAPHSTTAGIQRIPITQPVYNEAGLLERVDVWQGLPAEPEALLAAHTASRQPVKSIAYNAKGQRVHLRYGNGSETGYDYDKATFRLKRLKTTRESDGALLQDLNYTYDPVGNVTQIRDNVQDLVFHNNRCVLPGAKYRYDALYRLIAASGREHRGNGRQYDGDDSSRFVPMLPNDCQALQNYVETYRYDEVGNIMQMVHHAGSGLEQPGQAIWNRRYQYASDSNRLLAASVPGDPDNMPDYAASPGGYGAKYTYDLHGNMTAMPHLSQMSWDFNDRLIATTSMVRYGDSPPDQVPAATYYVYDAAGRRVRKVTETQTGALRKQRIYFGGYEVYREYGGGAVELERESLHVTDGQQRVALMESQTIKDRTPIVSPQPLVRYQLGNHLGSASLELDENAAVITYEEYTPYGSTAYCAGRSAAEASLKRYRYTGKERDEESGFSYHGARYYAPWLGRWTSCDPIGIRDGTNLFQYVQSNPVRWVDYTGTQTQSKNAEHFAAGKAWERKVLDLVKERIPTVEQVTVKATIDGKVVESVLDGLGLDKKGWIVIESKLSAETELTESQKKIREHLLSGKAVTLSATDKAKIAEIADKLKVSPSTPISTSRYEIIRRGNVGKVLSELEVIPKGYGTVLHASGELSVHSQDEMQIIAAVMRNHPGMDSKTAVSLMKRAIQEQELAKNNVNRVQQMMKTNINQNAEAQAHGEVRMSIAVGGGINTLAAFGQILNLGAGLGYGALGGTATAGGASATEGAGGAGASAWTRVRVHVGIRIAEGVGVEATEAAGAEAVEEEIAHQVLKRMVIPR
ncbi:toxin [Paenibacillus hemerocallicola]|uniref:Toxin n=1 Tax=Paenibacillus hemerocallicola TaxID=1172614 RepID=A0A5C4T6U3_9BACL|nr:SpvB/TcaC N-terminal domain-containing protein [Paenibacillus hemerocallicola]TNJ64555.1 toxin [Paenibacillus hemerocallicola]